MEGFAGTSEFLDEPHLMSVCLVLLDPLVYFCIFLCHCFRIVSISWWNQRVEGLGDTIVATKCLKRLDLYQIALWINSGPKVRDYQEADSVQ